MIDPKEMLETLVDHLAVTAQVQNVFGDPIEAHGKTIIPIARVSYCLGAGGGGGADSESEKTNGGGGGGEWSGPDRWAPWRLPNQARASSASSIGNGPPGS